MKSLFQIIGFILLLTSCINEKIIEVEQLKGFNLLIGQNCLFDKTNIDYYDNAAHKLYLKGNNSFGNDLSSQEFKLIVDGDIIYEGPSFRPVNEYEEQELAFLNFNIDEQSITLIYLLDLGDLVNHAYDPRNDKDMLSALKEEGLFRSGLETNIDSVYRSGTNQITIRLEVCNNDRFNYYFLNPEKMTREEYRYLLGTGFTMYNLNFVRPYDNYYLDTLAVNWYCQCDNERFYSLVKPGETSVCTIDYLGFDSIPAGEYYAAFNFWSYQLFMATNSDLNKNGQIWSGGYPNVKKITLE